MSKTAPHKGEFLLLATSRGEVIVPDLAEPLVPLLRSLSRPEELPFLGARPCSVSRPRLIRAREPVLACSREELESLEDGELWRIHRGLLADGVREPLASGSSLLDLKIVIGRRLLQQCTLCEHRCGVNRLAEESGFCELGASLAVSGYSMLYNEGPFVGQPSFGVFLKGCSLRCEFCYRPADLKARRAPVSPAGVLAGILDRAAECGAESWHFLGGNPDESLVGVLEVLRRTAAVRPVVWNSALYLSPEGLALLQGIVDIWLPDLKFGNDECASKVAGVRNYGETVRRNLLSLAPEEFLVVRHMVFPGHEQCCQARVERWVHESLPRAQFHRLKHVRVGVATGRRPD